MSRAPRNAVAGLALAAAGVLYRRVTGRRPEPEEPAEAAPPPVEPEQVDAADVARARDELADELARRAAEKPR